MNLFEQLIQKKNTNLRKKGQILEKAGQLEEAYRYYRRAAKRKDADSMILIARMYLSGEFHPVDMSNLSEAVHQGGQLFPWSFARKKQPDYRRGIEWLIIAADLEDDTACTVVGNILCQGLFCQRDYEKGIAYLEKAAAKGNEYAVKYLGFYRPDGKVMTDKDYEEQLARFVKAVDEEDACAKELYESLKCATSKQLARLGYVLISAQSIQRKGYETYEYSITPSGIPLLPVVSRRGSWCTLLRFNLDAWTEQYPIIGVASDILNFDEPSFLLRQFYRARIIGKVKFKSPTFGWLDKEEKEGIVIRLGEESEKDAEDLSIMIDTFHLSEEEYMGDSVALMAEYGEKEYSFEIIGIDGSKIDVLWRYTVGGVNEVEEYIHPELLSLELE